MQHQESAHKQPIVFKPEHGEVEFQVILDGELDKKSTWREFRQVQNEGGRKSSI